MIIYYLTFTKLQNHTLFLRCFGLNIVAVIYKWQTLFNLSTLKIISVKINSNYRNRINLLRVSCMLTDFLVSERYLSIVSNRRTSIKSLCKDFLKISGPLIVPSFSKPTL